MKNNKKQPRICIDREEFIKKNNNLCVKCNLPSTIFEIDHIVPLSTGGSNNEKNLQLLCKDCHSIKTIEENNLGYELIDDEASFYNEVSNNIMKSWAMKSWQFVEKISHDVKELNNKFLPKIKTITQFNNLDKYNNEIKIDSIFQKNDNYIKVKKIKQEEEIIDDTSLNQ